jgi:hypothetical protein
MGRNVFRYMGTGGWMIFKLILEKEAMVRNGLKQYVGVLKQKFSLAAFKIRKIFCGHMTNM